MHLVYYFLALWAILAVIMLPLALRQARHFDRQTPKEVAEARLLSERDICYRCGGPIMGPRRHKRAFDICEPCAG